MGEADRYREYRPQRKTGLALGTKGNNLMNLFTILAVFFILLFVIQVSYNAADKSNAVFEDDVIGKLAIPNSWESFLSKPWTLFTYVFTESSTKFWRFATNLIWLWGFGSLFQQMAGNKKLIPVFLYGSFLGGLFFVLATAFLNAPFNTPLWGANTGILALAAAATAAAPNFKFFKNLGGGIPIWVLFTVFLMIDIAGVRSFGYPHVAAHIGGAAAGWIFMLALRKGYDGSEWMSKLYTKATTFFDPYKKDKDFSARNRNFYDAGKRIPFTRDSIITQEKVDEILDKINQKGYHFLTDEEKNILKRASEEDVY